MTEQFHLDNFRRYYRRGLNAHRKGDLALARMSLLKAAEMLYKLAAESKGELRTVRKQKARRLLELARSMPAETNAQLTAGPAAARSEDADGAGGEKWIMTTLPDVRMDDVAGLDDVKDLIRRRVIYPFMHPEVTEKYRKKTGGGVLLYGPPGNGKTMIARAIAAEIDATFFSVKCSDIISKWVGEAERNLKTLFESAREHPRAVLFMDETEAIVAKRGGDSTVMNRVIPEFLSQVDGMQGRHSGLLLLGATNRPWDMDEAALRTGRFGELIYVPLPDLEARRRIIAMNLTGIPLAEDVDLDELAVRTEGYTGADLEGLCERAKDAPYEREIATGEGQCLEFADILSVMDGMRLSVSKGMMAKYEKFRHGD